jgi:hypothetical protein
MIRRLFKVVLFLITVPFAPIEVIIWGIRWILTGKPFPDNSPISANYLFDD